MELLKCFRRLDFGKKLISCFLAGVLLMFSFSAISYAGDEEDEENNEKIEELKNSISEKQTQLNDLATEKKTLINGKTNVENLKKNLTSSRDEISNLVEELDTQVATLQDNIDTYADLVATKQEEIVVTTAEVEAAEATVEEYYTAMKERIRYVYERGDTQALELILTATSLSDMLNKEDYVEALEVYDRQKLEEYQLVVEYCELVKEELLEEQSVLEEAQTALLEEQENLNELIDTKIAEIEAYNTEINNTQAAINEFNEELEAQESIISALEAAIAADKAALSEATRRHYDGGMFVHPCPGYVRVSSEYGTRKHPISGVTKLHNGIDLAAPAGTPIYAAYNGTVVAASYTAAMGNYIMIDHGDNLYTIYMHCSKLFVSTGQAVVAGDHIAAVGTTGSSTGNHLHFTVRNNGQYENPRNYFTP